MHLSCRILFLCGSQATGLLLEASASRYFSDVTANISSAEGGKPGIYDEAVVFAEHFKKDAGRHVKGRRGSTEVR